MPERFRFVVFISIAAPYTFVQRISVFRAGGKNCFCFILVRSERQPFGYASAAIRAVAHTLSLFQAGRRNYHDSFAIFVLQFICILRFGRAADLAFALHFAAVQAGGGRHRLPFAECVPRRLSAGTFLFIPGAAGAAHIFGIPLFRASRQSDFVFVIVTCCGNGYILLRYLIFRRGIGIIPAALGAVPVFCSAVFGAGCGNRRIMQKHVYVFGLFRHRRFPVTRIIRRLLPAVTVGRRGRFGFRRLIRFGWHIRFSRFFGFSRLIRLVGSFGIVPAFGAAVFAVRIAVLRTVAVCAAFALVFTAARRFGRFRRKFGFTVFFVLPGSVGLGRLHFVQVTQFADARGQT